MLLREGRLAPVFYFPRDDVRMDLLATGSGHSYCPYRGIPVYFDLQVEDSRVTDIAWSYEDPQPESSYVKDYIAFYRDKLDHWELSEDQPSALDTPSASPNPLVDWVLREAWQSSSLPDLVTRWIEAMDMAGIRLLRFALVTRTLHPLLSGFTYRWSRGDSDVTELKFTHEILTSAQYLGSPLAPIFEGAGGVRRRLAAGAVSDDFPVLKDIRDEGGTDYVAMPLVFSDGQINAVTMATDRPGGFETAQLGLVNEVLPLIARLVEVFIQREKSVILLDTYLGGHTGKRVLEGRVRRGDGEDIHAVIWFCDLRKSSALAASMSRPAFLAFLNRFFDCMAGAVLDNGGEVLRFIGDAALAIFPMAPMEKGEEGACRRALAAAEDASLRVAAFNAESAQADPASEPMEFGIGLHIGDVMYGNIGTESRLEFTVIGAAANEAARLEGLCKVLGHDVLLSEEVATMCPGEYTSLGHHLLPGTGRTTEVFTPRRGDAT
jgi:adenylate cyclase